MCVYSSFHHGVSVVPVPSPEFCLQPTAVIVKTNMGVCSLLSERIAKKIIFKSVLFRLLMMDLVLIEGGAQTRDCCVGGVMSQTQVCSSGCDHTLMGHYYGLNMVILTGCSMK